MKINKKATIMVTALVLVMGSTVVHAAAMVNGYLKVSSHTVPILEDSALAYTTLIKPSKDVKNCASNTTVKIYNSAGDYNSDTYSLNGGMAWDLPLNAGAVAKIRGAKKAVGTHKAKSYDTNYQWLKTDDTHWSKE